ncbi:MAG TPA: class C sortase [Lachnospiraceae bacterium]|nr:class C sortase [Lachnospiraceae bacterium]
MEKKNKRNKLKRRLKTFLLTILFLIGMGITFYPVVSKTWNQYRDSRLISDYEEAVRTIPEDRYESILREAREYNEQHLSNNIVDAFNQDIGDYILTHPYDTLLNPTGNMIMGSVEIPKINVSLPIYHGIGSDVLEKGIGHIEGTSLPIGGANTHTVLAGHRGLPGRQLLTDLDQVDLNDFLYLKILNETLAYKVDQVTVVEPHETKGLAIETGQDLVTIVTCTPYGVNSHRLLVRGHRIPYVEQEKEIYEALNTPETGREEKLLMIGLGIFAILVIFMLLVQKLRSRTQG